MEATELDKMDKETAFNILELRANSSFDEVKTQYRDLVSIWHPDRFTNNSRLRKKAEEKLKDINAAYDFLKRYRSDKRTTSQNRSKEQSSSSETIRIINCEHCGAKNIYHRSEFTINPLCKSCGKFVKKAKTEGRTPCGDNKCTGIINENGRCGYCGKTLAEGKEENRRRHNEHEEYYSSARKTKKERSYGWLLFLVFIVFCFFAAYHDSHDSDNKPNRSKIIPSTNKNNKFYIDLRNANPYRSNMNFDKIDVERLVNQLNFDKDECKLVQKSLNILGLNAGNPDGISGNKTKKALKEFIILFQIPITKIRIEEFIDSIKYNAVLTLLHPDWYQILSNPEKINKWINSTMNNKQRNNLKNMFGEKNPIKVSVLLNKYKFYRDSPKPDKRPLTSVLSRSDEGSGVAPLTISTRSNDIDYFVKLVEPGNFLPEISLYIRGGEKIEIKVPLGDYEIKYAVGKNWYGENYLFGGTTQVSKTDKIFNFKTEGNQVVGYTVELFLQTHGNLKTTNISMYDF